ncbi:MAG: RNA methyltransferase [Acidobacteriaceae bacterium]|nr:RNA methyltransferase [Acidobacteriaceae bacterium]
MQLTSTKNPLLQSIRRAAAAGRPLESGAIVAEGPLLLQEALRSRWTLEGVFATPGARERHFDLLSRCQVDIVEVSPRAFASVAATEATQGVLALLRPRPWDWEQLAGGCALLAVLDAIQDPGNAGAIIRSAEAFGASGVVLLKGAARVANGKLLRASAGSIFRIPFLEEWQAGEFAGKARESGLELWGLAQNGKTSLDKADFRARCALIVGNEAHGFSPELEPYMQPVSIPTRNVESLNAAVACSIALFEARKQRDAA